jgi:hypothetical protein
MTYQDIWVGNLGVGSVYLDYQHNGGINMCGIFNCFRPQAQQTPVQPIQQQRRDEPVDEASRALLEEVHNRHGRSLNDYRASVPNVPRVSPTALEIMQGTSTVRNDLGHMFTINETR